jgi:hypothetical protein
MSRKDGRRGVLYIPPGREASFVQTLPLSLLLKVRATGTSLSDSLAEMGDQADNSHNQNSMSKETIGALAVIGNQHVETDGKGEPIDPIAIAELVAHLRDFGITTFAQVAPLTKEGLTRRIGWLGSWVYQVANGEDDSLVIPDAPPLSQNARVRFQHHADADETCAALRKLSDYLSERLTEQRLKGQTIALILWPNQSYRENVIGTVPTHMGEEREGARAMTVAEETIGGQMTISRHTDEADIIAYHSLMLFAHYHRPGVRYLQVQLRVADIIISTPTYYPPPTHTHTRIHKLTRKL